jgi:anaerobic selenocysteine-containing dehydrogenase
VHVLRRYEDLPTIGGLDELAELVKQSSEARDLYVRWSRGPAADLAGEPGGASSRDSLTGMPLPGLSANSLAVEDWWGDRPVRLWVARRLYDYQHLKEVRGKGTRSWVLVGEVRAPRRSGGRRPSADPAGHESGADERPAARDSAQGLGGRGLRRGAHAGFEQVERVVQAYGIDRVAGICDLKPADIERAAAAVAVNDLHLLRGMIGRPGAGVLQMNGQPTAQNTRETGADGDLPGFRNWDNPSHVRELAELWNVDMATIPHWAPPTHAMQFSGTPSRVDQAAVDQRHEPGGVAPT